MDQQTKRINASPTKEFFIHMLTRDIPLSRAILDLVDNCVDGARKIRPDGDYTGLWVRLELNAKHFRIVDNCGGIPVEVARNYAFRFGRPKDAPATPGSVGQFGVGMKRSFFKLGRHIIVQSTTSSSRFSVDLDVDAWLNEPDIPAADGWHFEFALLDEDSTDVPPEDIGTSIEVTRLHDTVSQSFCLDSFVTGLQQEVSVAHALPIDRGLSISINQIPLGCEPQRLFTSDQLRPAFVEKEYPGDITSGRADETVRVKLYTGVASRDYHDGGWYIFCNGRLVLRADKTPNTVWGPIHNTRQYHGDLAYFRGYAFFDSDNASLLPWTTTKTGVDTDSPLYKSVQQEMVELSKPVITFLTNLAKEKAMVENGEAEKSALEELLRGVTASPTVSITAHTHFVAPTPPPTPSGPKMQKIQYSKPLDDVKRAMQLLGVSTYTAVGEKTFDYYMEYEGEE